MLPRQNHVHWINNMKQTVEDILGIFFLSGPILACLEDGHYRSFEIYLCEVPSTALTNVQQQMLCHPQSPGPERPVFNLQLHAAI